MKLIPIAPFGVQIDQLNLAEPLAEDTASRIKHLLADHCVVVFRDQHALTDQGFLDVLSNLGTLTFTQGETPVPGAPQLNLVTNVGRTTKPRSVFHTDTSYVTKTPAYTALRIVTVPQAGGDTLFTNQYTAFDTLPARIKNALTGARVLHQVTGLDTATLEETETWHDLVRRHPLNNRPALYLSTPERCVALSTMPGVQGQRVIKALYQHAIRTRRLLRHRWRAGDVVMWDNRCTMHRADHSDVIGDRTLHRGMTLASA
ncbi:MAG: TauD/TfdA family dioxygenase [Pseudomonadota bacterium]